MNLNLEHEFTVYAIFVAFNYLTSCIPLVKTNLLFVLYTNKIKPKFGVVNLGFPNILVNCHRGSEINKCLFTFCTCIVDEP